METVVQLLDWFWKLDLDSLIIPWAKANTIPIGAVCSVFYWWVKKTPSTVDDELLEKLKSIWPVK